MEDPPRHNCHLYKYVDTKVVADVPMHLTVSFIRTHITHIGRYTLYRQELEHVFEQQDLGVILHAKLKFDEHISV